MAKKISQDFRGKLGAKIRDLREEMGLTQGEMAERLGIRQNELSRFETGARSPEPDMLAKIAQVGEVMADWLVGEEHLSAAQAREIRRKGIAAGKELVHIGMDRITYFGGQVAERAERFLLPSINIVSPEEAKKLEISEDFVPVRLLSNAAAAGSPREIDPSDVEGICVIYRRWLTHPDDTTCIRIIGDSMHPVLQDGSIVAVNHAIRLPEDVAGRIVAAQVEDEGVVIKWLRQTKGGSWILESENREHPIIEMEEPSRIIGKVEWAWSLFR